MKRCRIVSFEGSAAWRRLRPGRWIRCAVRDAQAIAFSSGTLRPILMTAFAFILGVLLLVIATGPGSEMRQALGITVFAGMLGVTVFGLFLTPVFYVTIRNFTMWLNRRRTPSLARLEQPPAAEEALLQRTYEP